jgi:cytochrome b pre-mRNA-processing protein 3
MMERARAPEFFTRLAVPDTMDGRFDLVALHARLLLERLDGDPPLAQAVIDEVFLSFDEALRHLGTGDAAMNRRLKTLAGAFYGRLQAYRSAASPEELAKAIQRNLYRRADDTSPQARALAAYAMAARSHLSSVPGEVDFGPLPIM